MAGRFEHEKRACETLRQLVRTTPLLLITHSKHDVDSRRVQPFCTTAVPVSKGHLEGASP